MAFSKFLLWLLLNNICVFSLNYFAPQPKIITEDGHLIFRAAEDRNISLQTKGKGKVHFNGVDLSNAAQLIRSASDILNKYTVNFKGPFNKIDKFEAILRGKNGILQRLTLLESTCNNSTGSEISNPKINRLTRQLKAAQDSLKSMIGLLVKNECQSNPCANAGVCQDVFNDFICHCLEGWEGRLCDTDVNECARFVGTDLGCQNGATCINKRGSYRCICPHGWYGIHCTRRSEDCSSGSSGSLCGHGTCISQNTKLGYTCICDQGWTKEESLQECSKDVDECKTNRPPCSVNPLVTCENTPGSFRCGSCPAGYTGNGYYCTDINECEVLNGGCSMNPRAECINIVGSRKCGSCPPGYFGDGITCSYKGVCNVNNGGCHPLASCKNDPRISSTFVECTCPFGYSGNGLGPYGCIQSASSPCSPNPCKNGNCTVNNTSAGHYTCKCKSSFFGKNCDKSFNACGNNPCRNGATCLNIGVSFLCICTRSWTGPTCSSERSACGGHLESKIGNLKYPPGNFSVGRVVRSCGWIIETSTDKVLNITFKQFHLKKSQPCNKDWLQIHDGRNSAAHIIGRFCGTDLPKNGSLQTTHNTIYIWYRTDGLSNSGFDLDWNSTAPTCTFEVNVTTHGTLQSPGSPGNYPNNRDCYWKIMAPEGKRVLFHFFSFDIGSSVNCTEDYLEFISSEKGKPFAKYCDSKTLPSPLHSNGPNVQVHFHSDEKNQYAGFQISYSVTEGVPGCGGVFTYDHGEIQSPTYKGVYMSDLSCEYKIKLAEGLRIKIEFVSFELESDPGCEFDYLEIYAGSDTSAPLIGRYCGKKIPAPFISNGNQIAIYLKTDWATDFKGFTMRYETVCGGKLTEPSGLLESDGYPERYTPGLSCLYEIIQPPGYIIELSFLDFNLETGTTDSEGECYDYLEIRDGDNENATLVGRYCDEKLPPRIVSSFNHLWIKFISDESVGGKGFRANYTTTNIGCGGILKEKVGTISPPGLGGYYSSGKKCNWVIAAPSGTLIQLTWITFQLDERFDCSQDYVLLYDNNTNTERGGLVGQYCGNRLPPAFVSTSNVLTIVFGSDYNANVGGFTLSYHFVEEAKLCSGNFISPGGVLRSPGYPQQHSTNSDCTWTITVAPGHQILLNITRFEFEKLGECKYDWLEIRNGKSSSSPLIGRYCGNDAPKTIVSHTNQIYIHFKSDVHGFGFEMIWESSATGCGGTLTAPSGSIVSPMYPESYSRFTNCYWKISVSAGSLIQMIFNDIDLELQVHCMLDYVELYDGKGISSKSLGRFCRPTPLPFIQSTQNHVFVRFKSDVNFQGRGFQLQYSTVCRNNLTGFYGVIESPNFPYQYPLPSDCTWNISVQSKNKINITFSDFDIRKRYYFTNKKCDSNYLEIKYLQESDTGEFVYESYGKYCESNVPKLITLDHDHAQIRYVTDSSMAGTGFRLEWVLEGCGGKLYKQGSIKSPNYPNGYPVGTACKWVLEADFGNIIEITFPDVDIEKVANCEYDSIKVFNGPDASYSLLGHFCHQENSTTLSSIGNKMSVYFTSDVSYVGKGFYANFTSVKTKCGGKMKISKGTISSPNYPGNFDKNITCEWLLEVDNNHLIDLKFEDVQLLSETFCKRLYIKVYDGPSAAYPVLDTICGTKKPNNTITSTHNTLTVEFASTTSFFTSKGFKANFQKACGARIVASDTGNLRMDSQHDATLYDNCTWTIIAPELDEQVSLTINHMNTPNHDCSFEHPVVVYNGESSSGKPVGEFCGTKVPPTITSSGNALHVVVLPDVQFFATYTVYGSRCGGTLTSFEGNFATPGYPNIYPLETDCEWTLHVAPGNHISLNFQQFDIPQSEKCKTDYLEIRKYNSSGKILGIFCGTKKPNNITNMGSLWLYFKSSKPETGVSSINAKGFIAEYKLDEDNVISAPSGSVANPLYPEYFWSYAEYTWRISVQFGKKISISVKELFLESYDTGGCTYSGLKIYDGIDNTAPLLQTLCGFEIPDPMKTTSNEVFIEGNLNAVRTGAKFLIEWQEIESYEMNTEKNNTIEGCGSKEVLDINDLRNYTLKSPGFPGGYANNLKCEWILSTIPMNHLGIMFEVVDLEAYYGSFSTCFLDHIEISSGLDGTQKWQMVKDICTDNNTSIISTTNLMKVKFITNYYNNGTGFLAHIREVCGGSLHQSEGFIIFNDTYPRGSKCEWNITVGAGRTIKISFPVFDIYPGQKTGCRNYLTFRNGHLLDSPIIGNGKYCGLGGPVLNTTGNQLNVKYMGISSVKGFTLYFEEVPYGCGGDVELNLFKNSSVISSPNYPNTPSAHIDCIWVIRSLPGTSIQLDFEERFDLTPTNKCEKEAVEIRNGATEFSPLIGRFCKSIPNTQHVTDNMMYVKYFTNVNDPRNGFQAVVSLASCGGTLRGTKGQFHWLSTNKGLLQNHNNCSWRIVAPEDYSLTLKIDEVSFLINFMSCNLALDKITIYSVDKIKRTENLIKTICNKNSHPDLSINGNEAIIRFTQGFKEHSPSVNNYFRISYTAKKQNCTFNMNTASGTIQSPDYPRQTYSWKRCKWTIKVPEGRRIKFRIVDLDFDDTVDSHSQGIVLLNSNRMMTIAALYNNNRSSYANKVFRSSSNVMYVYFWSVNSHGRGFSAEYTSNEQTVCKGSFNESSGLITMPTVPSSSCSWKRTQSDMQTTVKVSFFLGFKSFSLVGCNTYNGGASVFGEDERSRLILFRFCTNTTNPVILRTSYPELTLEVWGKRNMFNYSINYDTYKCGGMKTTETGFVSSPGFPRTPATSTECSWVIKLFPDQQINVTFAAFDLGDDCDKSFLEIYNGRTPTAPKIGKFCKNNKPDFVQSERNFLLINYHFEEGSSGKGFNSSYEPIIEGCGGLFHSKNRIIQTPGYPKDYPNNTECIWEVRADEGYHIGLSFIGRFHLEESDACIDDNLKIWEWKNDQWILLKTLCGRETPPAVNSTGNRMKIMFRSNEKIQARGFKAMWEFNCGGIFDASDTPQFISSPGYPLKYPNNVKCEYIIKSPSSEKYVNLKFTDFNLESGMPSCVSDNVTIKGLIPYYQPLTRTVYCGDAKPSDMRHRNGVKITFISDSWVVRRGYRFSFSTDGCGGNITSPTKISTSSLKSSSRFSFVGRTRCIWNITAPEKKIIVLRFESLQTSYTASCSYDNIVIYGGHDIVEEKKLATLCGNLTNSLPTISTQTNAATILSIVDPTSTKNQFSIDIFFTAGPSEGCGGNFNLTSTKVIQAPSINEIVDCNWIFIAPAGNQLEFEITDLNLPRCNKGSCSCSFLEVRDGGSSFATLIKKFCNSDNSVRSKYQSSTRYGFLRYHVNGAANNAFRITVTPIPSKCGESMLNVTKELKTLISPNYPNQYPENIRCSWFFKTKETFKKFVLRFRDFELSDEGTDSLAENDCKHDYLEIEDGNQLETYGLGLGKSTVFSGRGKSSKTYDTNMMGFHTFCGRNDKPFDYFSSTSAVTLIFQSKYGMNRGKGFKVEYQLIGCNQNYTRESGKIKILVSDNEQCIVGVSVASNRTIAFYVSQFYSSYSKDCTNDYVTIIDGDLETGKQLGKWCGYNLIDPVFSETNKLWLKTHSTKDYSPINIDLSYTSTEKGKGCGGSFYDVSGKFTSPLYPNDYRNDTECKWQVRGTKGSRYVVRFSIFDIQAACNINYVEVTTYEKDLGNIHRFCKNDNPAILYSDGKFEVTYVSSVHNGGRGWVINFRTSDTEDNSYITGLPVI